MTLDEILDNIDSLPGPLSPDNPMQVLAVGVRNLRSRIGAAACESTKLKAALAAAERALLDIHEHDGFRSASVETQDLLYRLVWEAFRRDRAAERE